MRPVHPVTLWPGGTLDGGRGTRDRERSEVTSLDGGAWLCSREAADCIVR